MRYVAPAGILIPAVLEVKDQRGRTSVAEPRTIEADCRCMTPEGSTGTAMRLQDRACNVA
jgi:hypothetical protein